MPVQAIMAALSRRRGRGELDVGEAPGVEGSAQDVHEEPVARDAAADDERPDGVPELRPGGEGEQDAAGEVLEQEAHGGAGEAPAFLEGHRVVAAGPGGCDLVDLAAEAGEGDVARRLVERVADGDVGRGGEDAVVGEGAGVDELGVAAGDEEGEEGVFGPDGGRGGGGGGPVEGGDEARGEGVGLHVVHGHERDLPRRREALCRREAGGEVRGHAGAAGHRHEGGFLARDAGDRYRAAAAAPGVFFHGRQGREGLGDEGREVRVVGAQGDGRVDAAVGCAVARDLAVEVEGAAAAGAGALGEDGDAGVVARGLDGEGQEGAAAAVVVVVVGRRRRRRVTVEEGPAGRERRGAPPREGCEGRAHWRVVCARGACRRSGGGGGGDVARKFGSSYLIGASILSCPHRGPPTYTSRAGAPHRRRLHPERPAPWGPIDARQTLVG
ncbi:LOW QUALITY PROTEIN: collagen alpha-2(I) chain [Colletotrichum tofieldiae]|nr:LOW QUALITY PROTEIN: collagen alpha-2(I) chain [Colletotrichum tofieldiae]